MKLFQICVTAVFAFFVMADQALSAPAPQKKDPYPRKTCGGIDSPVDFRIVGFQDYPPFAWTEEDLKFFEEKHRRKFDYRGFIVEELTQALKDIKITKVEGRTFDSFFNTLKGMLHGKADLLFTTYYMDESKFGLDFVYPAYFDNPFVLVSRRSKKINADDLSQLKGLLGVVRNEEEVEPLIRGLMPTDAKLIVVDGPEEAFRMLLSGQVDFMVTSPYAAEAEARRFKIRDEIYIGNKVMRHINYFIAFSKMSRCRRFKPLLAKAFSERFKDKKVVEAAARKSIEQWVAQHADEPRLEYTPVDDSAPQPTAPDQN